MLLSIACSWLILKLAARNSDKVVIRRCASAKQDLDDKYALNTDVHYCNSDFCNSATTNAPVIFVIITIVVVFLGWVISKYNGRVLLYVFKRGIPVVVWCWSDECREFQPFTRKKSCECQVFGWVLSCPLPPNARNLPKSDVFCLCLACKVISDDNQKKVSKK